MTRMMRMTSLIRMSGMCPLKMLMRSLMNRVNNLRKNRQMLVTNQTLTRKRKTK